MPSDAIVVAEPVFVKETHVYKYTSDLYGTATIMLYHSADGNSVEFLSSGSNSAEHGSWGICPDGFLRIQFNCREGASRPRRGGDWALHPTVLWREGDDWVGGDDKGASITMEHRRSIQVTKSPDRRPGTTIIDAL